MQAMEESFVYSLKSQLVCETNYITSSLSTLVCDCIGDGEKSNGGMPPLLFLFLSFFLSLKRPFQARVTQAISTQKLGS